MDSRRALSVAGLTGSAALLAAAGGATWFYASRVMEPPQRRPTEPLDSDRVVLVSLSDDEAVLTGPDADRPGWWGVRWDGGYARVGPPNSRLGDHVTRPVEFRRGEAEPRAPALLDPWAAPADDPGVLGVPVDEVVIDGPIGPLPAWRFSPAADATAGVTTTGDTTTGDTTTGDTTTGDTTTGDTTAGDATAGDATAGDATTAVGDGAGSEAATTWAVLVHGRSGSRVETLRLAAACLDVGLTALAVSYRNDPDAPPSPDRRSHLGATEWQDVDAAVAWALTNGAEDIVLVGQSMGGACVAEVLRRSPLAHRVRAVVLEAPVLDWGPVIRHAAIDRGLPPAVLPLLLPPTMALAGARGRIDFRSLGSFDGIEDVPVLLVHGDADTTVPVELADALAATAPEVVDYLRVAGAGHLRAWNHARDEVEAAVVGFLTTHT